MDLNSISASYGISDDVIRSWVITFESNLVHFGKVGAKRGRRRIRFY
jgi:hypothetical protein